MVHVEGAAVQLFPEEPSNDLTHAWRVRVVMAEDSALLREGLSRLMEDAAIGAARAMTAAHQSASPTPAATSCCTGGRTDCC